MKNLKILFLFCFVSLFIQSCSKTPCEKSCFGCVQIDQPFYLTYDCPAVLMENDEVIFEISLVEINDKRTLGNMCEVSTGGKISAQFHINNNNSEFQHQFNNIGCLGEQVPIIGVHQIAFTEINNLRIYALKAYPRSRIIDKYPAFEDYEFLMKIVKI